MDGPSRNTLSRPATQPRANTHPLRGAQHPDCDADVGLNPTQDVWETDEPTHSTLLDASGKPIPYQSKKLGYVGFVKLTERTT